MHRRGLRGVRAGRRRGRELKKLEGFVASFLRHWGELAADFRQFYGIDLPLPEEDVPDAEAWRCGELWAQLPCESRTVCRLSPDSRWDDATWLLWQAEYTLRCQLWSSTNDKKRPQPRPRPLETPGQRAAAERRRDNALAAKAEIMAALGMTDEG